MKRHQIKSWIFELREILQAINNSHYFLDSGTQFNPMKSFIYIFLHQERFLKLFDPRILSILLSRNLQESTRNQYFTIKGIVLVIVAIFIYRINNRNIVERKNIFFIGLLSIPINSIGLITNTVEESFGFVEGLSALLLYLYKGKNILEGYFFDPKKSTWFFTSTKRCSMSESSWGLCWCKNSAEKIEDSRCKIANKNITGLEISLEEKESKYLGFIFIYSRNDPTSKDKIHDWELVTCFSRKKGGNLINLNSGQLFDILLEDWICYLMSAFIEKIPIEVGGFFNQQRVGSTIQFNKLERASHLFSKTARTISLQAFVQFHMWKFCYDLFFSWGKNLRKWNVLSNVAANIQYDFIRSNFFVQVTSSRQLKGSSGKFGAYFNSIRTPNLGYSMSIKKGKIQQLKEKSNSLCPSFLQVKRIAIESDRFPKCPPVYSSIVRLFTECGTQTTIHLRLDEIAKFFRIPTRSTLSFLSNKRPEFHRSLNRSARYHKVMQPTIFFTPCRRSKIKVLDPIFRIIMYLQNTFLIRSLSSNPGDNRVPKKKPDIKNSETISFLNKKRIFFLVQLFYVRNKVGYPFHYDFKSDDKFKEMIMMHLFGLLITEPDLVYYSGFDFSIDFYKLDKKYILNEVFNFRVESQNKSLSVLPSIFYKVSEKNESFSRDIKIRKKCFWVYGKNALEVPKQNILRFVSNNLLEVGKQKKYIQYILIRNLIRIQYITYRFINRPIKSLLNRIFLIEWNFEYRLQIDQIGDDTLNHRTIIKYTINQHLSNFKLKKNRFDPPPFFSLAARSKKKKPNTYRSRYKRFNGIKNYRVCGTKNSFQGVFCINPYPYLNLIGWSGIIEKKDLSKLLFFFGFWIIPIHRFEIHIYELNGLFGNQVLESFGLQIIHLKKLKFTPFLLDAHDISTSSKLVINGGRISPLLFNKIPKWMVDLFYILIQKNSRKSFDNTDSYCSILLHDQDNWSNYVKSFYRSSLLSFFFNVNRLRLLNNPNYFCCYSNKRFPLSAKKAFIHNSNFSPRQFFKILFIPLKIFYMYFGKKKYVFLENAPIYPLKSQVFNIFLSNSFSQRSYEAYNLDKPLPFPICPDPSPFVHRVISLITSISGISRTECQIINFEITYRQSFSDMTLLDLNSKNNKLQHYFSSNGYLIHIPYSRGRQKKQGFWLKKCVEQEQMDRIFQVENVFPTFFKWNLVHPYMSMSWFLTLKGSNYLTLRFLEPLLELLTTVRRSQKLRISFHDIGQGFHISSTISQIPLWNIQRNMISMTFNKYFHNCLLSEKIINRNTESPLILLCLRVPTVQEFLYSLLLLLLVVGYLVYAHLFFVSQVLNELQIEFKKIKSSMISSYTIQLRKLLNRYPTNFFWLKNPFLVTLQQLVDSFIKIGGVIFNGNIFILLGGGPDYEVKSLQSKLKINCLNLINLTRFIPNSTNPISFSRNTKYFSHTSNEIYSLIRNKKESDWIDDKIESWVDTDDLINDEEREFLIEFSTLMAEKKSTQILWSLTHSDRLSKNVSGSQMIEQPGTIYFRYLVDIDKEYLTNYGFNIFCFAERRTFLAQYQTITYLQIPSKVQNFYFLFSEKSFSLRLALPPSKGFLVLGSIGTGRSFFIKSLVINSYITVITIFLNKFQNPKYKVFFIDNIDIDITIINLNSGNNNIDTELELLTLDGIDGMLEIDHIQLFSLTFEKSQPSRIIWIPNIHNLGWYESNYLSLSLLMNSVSGDYERCSTLVITSTHIPTQVDPVLLATNKLNTYIKIRSLLISQRLKRFFLFSYTKGFCLNKNNRFRTLIVGSSIRDLVTLVKEALSIIITQKKSIIVTNTIRYALHRQTWDWRSRVRPVQDHGIFIYQIGGIVAQSVHLNNYPIDSRSIYRKKKSCNGGGSYLYKWYFELGTNMKRLMILFYLLSCSVGSMSQDLWSISKFDEQNGSTSYGFSENDYDLAHGLLEGKGVPMGFSRTERNYSQFDNNRMTLLHQFVPRNLLDMLQNGSYFAVDQRFLLEKDESEEGDGVFDLQWIEWGLFNHIIWAPRVWIPWIFLFDWIKRLNSFRFLYWLGSFWDKPIMYDKEFQKHNLELLPRGTVQYQTQGRSSKEQGSSQLNHFIWDPTNLFFFLLNDELFISMFLFSHRKFFLDKERSEFCLYQMDPVTSMSKRWFTTNTQQTYFEMLFVRWRWLQIKGFFSSGLFPTSESFQYLANLFLFHEMLLGRLIKTFLKKKRVFTLIN